MARNLGERLELARKLKGWSAYSVDKSAELTPGHTRSIELGRIQSLEAHTALRLAGTLGVSLEWLLEGAGKGPEMSGRDGAPPAGAGD